MRNNLDWFASDDSLIALNKLIAAPVRMTFQQEAFE